jgi:hypothetical protein
MRSDRPSDSDTLSSKSEGEDQNHKITEETDLEKFCAFLKKAQSVALDVTGVAYRDLDAIWLSRWNRNKTPSRRHLGTSQSDAGKGRVFEGNQLQQVDRDGRDSS